jgi:hypothetical protein
MADPRDCAYREVVIRLRYRNAGQDQSIATHAWAFPEADDAPERFAIAADGQVYPAEVGGPADLRADVEAGLRALGKPREPNAPHVSLLEASLRADRITPVRAVQLLRVGEADLARRVWEAKAKELPPDPFPALAAEWAGALYDQTRFAHARGEDRVALAGARRLAKALPTLRPLAPPPPENGVGMWARGPFTTTLDFLDEVPVLLADQERRAREAPRPYDPKASQVERIAALIGGFDEIAVVQMSNPGGVYLGGSGVVQALIDEGEPAIDPLLDELGRPERLTRSVEASRSLGGGRRFLGTSGATAAALRALLDRAGVPGMPRETIETMSPDERRAVAAALRKAWHAVKDVPPAERWYRDLANDAGPDRWVAAAGNMVAPADPRPP